MIDLSEAIRTQAYPTTTNFKTTEVVEAVGAAGTKTETLSRPFPHDTTTVATQCQERATISSSMATLANRVEETLVLSQQGCTKAMLITSMEVAAPMGHMTQHSTSFHEIGSLTQAQAREI